MHFVVTSCLEEKSPGNGYITLTLVNRTGRGLSLAPVLESLQAPVLIIGPFPFEKADKVNLYEPKTLAWVLLEAFDRMKYKRTDSIYKMGRLCWLSDFRITWPVSYMGRKPNAIELDLAYTVALKVRAPARKKLSTVLFA